MATPDPIDDREEADSARAFSLDDAVIFVTVGELASFSAAAKQLGITRSAVTRAVAKLENALHTRLLQRTTRHVSLTAAGRELWERSRPSIQALAGVWRDIATRDGELIGRVRVGATPDVAMLLLAPAAASFAKRYPGVRLDLEWTTPGKDPSSEGFDVVLGFSPWLSSAAGRAHHVGEVTCQVFAAPSYLQEHGTPADLSELHRYTALPPPTGSIIEQEVLEALASCSKARVSGSDLLLCRELVRLGCGLGLLPSAMVEEDVARAELVPVLPTSVVGRLPLTLWSADMPLVSGLTNAFCEVVLSELSRRRILE